MTKMKKPTILVMEKQTWNAFPENVVIVQLKMIESDWKKLCKTAKMVTSELKWQHPERSDKLCDNH